MEMEFTDDCYTDGRDPSVTLLVLFLPTEFITVTDGISPSAKLYNVVVEHGGESGSSHQMDSQQCCNPKHNQKKRFSKSIHHLQINDTA